jgi:hypothetical protein
MAQELSKNSNSFAYSLNSNLSKIYEMYGSKSVSTESLRETVLHIVMSTNDLPLEKKSPATKRFIQSLRTRRNKDEIVFLVTNSLLKADGLGTI